MKIDSIGLVYNQIGDFNSFLTPIFRFHSNRGHLNQPTFYVEPVKTWRCCGKHCNYNSNNMRSSDISRPIGYVE
jgi:hypothetical protein